jgi:hypothetical protein
MFRPLILSALFATAALPAVADSALSTIAKSAARSISANHQDSDLVTFADIDVFEELLSGFGSVERDIDGEGIPYFKGRMSTVRYSLYFYGCSGTAECNNATFYAFFSGDDYKPDADALNTFNNEYRFGKASIDEDGDLELNFSFAFYGGLPRSTLEDTIDWWRVIVETAQEDFD